MAAQIQIDAQNQTILKDRMYKKNFKALLGGTFLLLTIEKTFFSTSILRHLSLEDKNINIKILKNLGS